MSKAILIVDIPNIEDHEIDSYDMVANVQVKSLLLGGERYDCNFENVIARPLPPKKDGQWIIYNNEENEYHVGWNDCIDKILAGGKYKYE